METYSPIPDSAICRPPLWTRRLGMCVFVIVVFASALAALRFTYLSRDDINLHSFGIVQTAFGPAEVQCGGESASPCNDASTLRFPACTEPALGYMTGYYGRDQDERVRRLIHARPPKGQRWEFSCGWYAGWPPPLTTPATLDSDD